MTPLPAASAEATSVLLVLALVVPVAGVLLAFLLGGLVPAVAVTHLVVGQYKAQRVRLADEWSTRGTRDLARAPAVAQLTRASRRRLAFRTSTI